MLVGDIPLYIAYAFMPILFVLRENILLIEFCRSADAVQLHFQLLKFGFQGSPVADRICPVEGLNG